MLLLTYTFRQVGWSFKLEIARKMIRFCWPLWFSGFAGLYIGSANRYYLRIFTSLDDIGLFELAVKFSTIISMMVWSPFSTYWQVERFNYYERGNADAIFQNIFYFISTMLILVALGISIFADSVIRVMAEPAFHKASQAVPYLCFGTVFDCLILYVNFPFLVKEKTGWISRNNYITAVIVTFLYLSLIPIAGHVGAALALMLAKGIQFFIVHHASQRFYDMGISMKPLIGMLLTSAIACFIADWKLGVENQLEALALKCILYVAACIIIVMPLWRRKEARRYLYKLAPRVFLKPAN
jgi:O-antigen/teichoic acid export membrane protein